MFSHAIHKAFSTSLDGISTIDAFDGSMMCEAYALYISHPSQCVVVINWGIPWMSQVFNLSPALNIFMLLVVALLFHLYPFLDLFFKQQKLLVGFFRVH